MKSVLIICALGLTLPLSAGPTNRHPRQARPAPRAVTPPGPLKQLPSMMEPGSRSTSGSTFSRPSSTFSRPAGTFETPQPSLREGGQLQQPPPVLPRERIRRAFVLPQYVPIIIQEVVYEPIYIQAEPEVIPETESIVEPAPPVVIELPPGSVIVNQGAGTAPVQETPVSVDLPPGAIIRK